MLFAVGVLAGRNWRARIGYSVIAFGVWDIFLLRLPQSHVRLAAFALDWDILFLLPMPWWGPVIAPVLISLLMIFWGTLASQYPPLHPPSLANWRRFWAMNITGILLAL